LKFDYQPADKLAILLLGRQDTFDPADCGAGTPFAPAVLNPLSFHVFKLLRFHRVMLSRARYSYCKSSVCPFVPDIEVS